MLMVVLGRERPSLFGDNISTTPPASIDAGVFWCAAGTIFFVKRRVIAGSDIRVTLVKRHKNKPFLFGETRR